MKPLISVVIPAYNEEKYIDKCLESLKNQTFPKEKFEIIVVDNGSTDKTVKIAKKYGVRVVYEKRRGIAYARQRGLLSAKGEIVCGTDADTILPPNWLEKIYDKFRNDKKLVGLGGGFEFWDDRSIFSKIICKMISMLGFLMSKTPRPILVGYNHSFRRTIILSRGGYETELGARHTLDDIALAIKFKRCGKFIYDPNLKVLTSSRRLKKHPIGYLVIPVIEYFRMFIFHKKAKFDWKPIR